MTSIAAGSRLGPYEIVSRLGAGGMGEVWRAIDTRLDRSVAVKVLPEAFVTNPQLQIRFDREAKTISQLNHPNICTLHDVGRENGVQYLVMELVEGESLADRIARGPLPLSDILRYGAQIADALDRAHRAGIVHRDLKPANVMLTKAGAKLLDFGLAKGTARAVLGRADGTTFALSERSGDGATAVRSSGAAKDAPLTSEGTIVGTFQYMAPEQLEGSEADARSDIFALGAVLYEMATGRRAFDGKTKTSLIAAIVGGQPPPIRELQPLTPPALEHVISRALEKDPQDRWQSARDVAEEFRWISQVGSQAGVPAATTLKRRHREGLVAAVALLLALAAAGLAFLYSQANARAARVVVSDLTPPEGMQFNNVGDNGGAPMLSPDGRYVVFSASDGITTKLWLRVLATGEARPLTGTEGAAHPFWSPDSRNVAFFTATHLKRVEVDGGVPIPLARVAAARGGAWSRRGVIVFTQATLSPISRVSENGGNVTDVTTIDHTHHSTHRWPSFLPDGKHFLFLAANHQDASSASNGIYIGSIDGGEQKFVMSTPGSATYAAGSLLFVRDTALYRQKMSEDGKLSGEPSVVVEGVLNDRGIWRGGFSTSDSGDLLYCAGQAVLASRMTWVDRSGKELGALPDSDMYWEVRLSPDQKKAALAIGDPSRQIWLVDLARNTRTRLDFGARWAGFPGWSADGKTVVAAAIRDDGSALIAKRIDGSPATVITGNVGRRNASGVTISPDNKSIVFGADGGLWKVPFTGGRPEQIMPPDKNVHDPAFSPDGKWLAFVSNENGRDDVFIALARDLTQRWQISTAGGLLPLWRPDGKEFYYVDARNRVTAVPVSSEGDSLNVGEAQALFPLQLRFLGHVYDVMKDGQRFFVNKIPENIGVGVKMVTNWTRLRPRG